MQILICLADVFFSSVQYTILNESYILSCLRTLQEFDTGVVSLQLKDRLRTLVSNNDLTIRLKNAIVALQVNGTADESIDLPWPHCPGTCFTIEQVFKQIETIINYKSVQESENFESRVAN